MAYRQVKDWITVNHKHVPIYEGESKQDAINRSIAKDNESKRQSDIKRNKDEADDRKGIKNKYVKDYRGYIDVDKSDIKRLYHWVEDDKRAEFVDKNGIVTDDQGLLYLSDRPLYETKPFLKNKGHLYEVTIDKGNKGDISDWRWFWYDDNGEEFDSDHQYDKKNPYFISTSDIPKKYLKKIF